MSLVKTELKAATMNEVGNKLEDQLEAAKGAFSEAKGIRNGLDVASRQVEAMSTKLDNEFKETPPKIAEDEYKIAKKHLGEVLKMLNTLVINAGNQQILAQGRIAAMDQAVKTVANMLHAEEGKIAAFKSGALVEEGAGLPVVALRTEGKATAQRAEGTHPGNPIAVLHAREVVQPAPKKRGNRRKKG